MKLALTLVAIVGVTGIIWLCTLCDPHKYQTCIQSHQYPITTYVKSGNMLIPITTWQTVCDKWIGPENPECCKD